MVETHHGPDEYIEPYIGYGWYDRVEEYDGGVNTVEGLYEGLFEFLYDLHFVDLSRGDECYLCVEANEDCVGYHGGEDG